MQHARSARMGARALVVAGIAALTLSGCGGGPAADSSASPQPTASSASSHDDAASPSTPPASASASTTGSSSPLPEDWRPQEPTVLATGQKVPDDYEPATLEHPARNVPKPVMPKEAAQETEAGAQAFLNYRADAQWYSIQTGDTSMVREVTSPDCKKCTKQFDAYDTMYKKGNWAAGGFERTTILSGGFAKRADGGYNLPVSVVSNGTLGVTNHKVSARQHPFDKADSFDVYIYWESGAWKYLTASPRGAM